MGKLNIPADTPLSTGIFIPFRSETVYSSKPPEQVDYEQYRQHRDHLHGKFLNLPVMYMRRFVRPLIQLHMACL